MQGLKNSNKETWERCTVSVLSAFCISRETENSVYNTMYFTV